jgi:hypothetical protein
MPPGEFSKRPPNGQSPYPRQRPSIDGIAGPQRRPVFTSRPPVAPGQQPSRLDFTPPIPAQPPAQTLPPTQTLPTAASTVPQMPLQFTPPVTRQRRHLSRKMVLIIVVVLVIAAGGFVALQWYNRQNNPDIAFQDALQASLSTTQLQAQTTAGSDTKQVSYDFTSLTNSIISSQATVQLDGSGFQLRGYGSSRNTYISYSKLPSVISGSVATAVRNGWVRLRANGTEAPGVSAVLTNLADPRYQAFGPVIFGNFPAKTRVQFSNFLNAHHVYAYNPKQVTRASLSGVKVFAYSITPNLNYLQIFNQSVATSEGFQPGDIQAAINALVALKGAKMTFYISVDSHRLQDITIVQGAQRTTTVYSNYNNVSLPNEPPTQLNWQAFAAVQLQMETQAAAHQSNADRDAARKADLAQLHGYLAISFTQNALYPTLADLDDQTWVANNLTGIDPDVFHDPQGATLMLANAPKAGSFAYQPLPASGKGTCDDTALNPCLHYKLTATLSNGQQYVVQDP